MIHPYVNLIPRAQLFMRPQIDYTFLAIFSLIEFQKAPEK